LFEKKVDEQLRSTFPGPSPDLKGGQDIRPEQIISYNIGYQGWFLNHRLRLRADLFFNHISDLISFRTVSATVVTPVNNEGSADIYGGEAGVEFLATRWLTGFANYSYQEIGQSFAGRIQRGAPRSKYSVGLRGEWDNGLNGEATLYHVGAATYPPGDAFTSLAAAGLVTIPDTRVGSYNLLNIRGRIQVLAREGRGGLYT
jgi:iron complex outermembrane receptor protein